MHKEKNNLLGGQVVRYTACAASRSAPREQNCFVTPMKLQSSKLNQPRRTRRQFLASAAAGLAAFPIAEHAFGQPTGPAAPKLAAYDELMTRFMREHKPPGAALAVAYHGRLVYARGFGHADVEKQEPVRPTSLFRIASISKPFTATAVMHLVEKGKLKLDDRVFPLLKLEPHLEPGDRMDPRWREITVQQCLQHTGGWNRDKSFDPMSVRHCRSGRQGAEGPPADHAPANHPLHDGQAAGFRARHGLRLFQFRLLRAGPGDRERFRASPTTISSPRRSSPRSGIRRMRLGKNLFKDRAAGEVRYYDCSIGPAGRSPGRRSASRSPLALWRGVHRDDGRQRRLDRFGGGPAPLRHRRWTTPSIAAS